MSEQLPPLPEDLAFLRDVSPPSPPAGFESAVAARLAPSLPLATAAGLTTGKLLGGGLAVLLAGVGVGVTVDRYVFPPEPREVRIEVPVRVEVPVEVIREVQVPVEAAPTSVKKPDVVRTLEKPREGARDTSLAAERKLLEVARSALARGELPGAFAALNEHERDFPRGRLVEEREALFIKTLHTAGRDDEAAARTRRFEATFPDSLLTP